MRWWRLLPILPAVVGGAFWVNGYVAKTADVEKIRVAVEKLSHELREAAMENRRSSLRSEQFRLLAVPHPTALEQQRSFDVQNELRDVEQALEHLRQEKP